MVEPSSAVEEAKFSLEKEDAVAFLARMREQSPSVLSALTTRQAKMLAKEPIAPYDSDEEYLKDMAAVVNLKQRMDFSKTALRNALLEPHLTKEVDVQSYDKQIMSLKEIGDRLTTIVEVSLQATEDQRGKVALPRIIRLCRKFQLTENETKIAIHALIIQSGLNRSDRVESHSRSWRYIRRAIDLMYDDFSHSTSNVLSLCQFLDIPLQEMLNFLSQDRLHMQQGFFPDVESGTILSCQVVYDREFYKALVGSRLKNIEFLKLEQTFLADVIAEEPGNEHYRDENLGLGKEPSGVEGSEEEEEAQLPMGLKTGEVEEKEEGEEVISAVTPVEEEQEKKEEEMTKKEPATENKPLEKIEVIEEAGKGKDEIGDLAILLRKEREWEKKRKERGIEEKEEDKSSDKLKPYKTDLEYLDDYFQFIACILRVKQMDIRIKQRNKDDVRYLRKKRQAESEVKVQEKRCSKRTTLTRQSGIGIPRLERMVESRGLSIFEKNVLLILIANRIQPDKVRQYDDCTELISKEAEVGQLLRVLCSGLEQQIAHRKYFYKSATLVHEGMIMVHNSGVGTGDPTTATVEIDRRMLDFCVGLDTEFSEIVEGSHLYYPKTKFDQVVLNKDQKDLILRTVDNFETYKHCSKRMGLDDVITYGAGMVMLFHGVPGTGKTMMANALANKLNKKILLINFPSLGNPKSTGENFKFVFREAKINDAILFFDECEAIFQSRETDRSHSVNLLLNEIERHNGLIIMATNRPYDLDEAMHRRIMIAIEFRQPDHLLRKAIWESHLPEQMKLADDIDLTTLSLRYELTGGFIKNAVLSALFIAVSRDGETPIVCQNDLAQGAKLQLRGRLRMKDFDRRIAPAAGLDEVIVEESVMRQLKEIVQFEKARSVLFGQWGFARRNHQGIAILLHGPSGTGKTLAAEAIGYEVGKPLKMVNCGELLSKFVGDSSKNIDTIFQEAHHEDAILVFDEAEGLFGSRTAVTTSTARYANMDVGILLYHIERFPGIIILTTNLIENIDKAFFRRLRFVLQLNVPSRDLRLKLWKLITPHEVPLSDDVDFERLSRYEMTGGNIKSVIFRAAARAALRKEDQRKITMKDLNEAADDELRKTSARLGFRRN